MSDEPRLPQPEAMLTPADYARAQSFLPSHIAAWIFLAEVKPNWLEGTALLVPPPSEALRGRIRAGRHSFGQARVRVRSCRARLGDECSPGAGRCSAGHVEPTSDRRSQVRRRSRDDHLCMEKPSLDLAAGRPGPDIDRCARSSRSLVTHLMGATPPKAFALVACSAPLLGHCDLLPTY